MTAPPPLLVLGLPRSGTTWLARAITVGVGGPYVHEPFNGNVDAAQARWGLLDPSPPELEAFEAAFDAMWATVERGPQPVLKDVSALFALARLAGRRRLPVVGVVRHPCAIANSLLELGWDEPGLELLCAQPRLLTGPLAPWAEHLDRCRRGGLGAAVGATWGATGVLLEQMRTPRSVWVTHEQACADPLTTVVTTLADLDVPLHWEGGRPALEAFLSETDRDSDDQQGQFRRTAQQPYRWRGRLDPAIERETLAAAAPFGLLERWFPGAA